VTLTQAAATTKAAIAVQRTLRIDDVLFMPDMTLGRGGMLRCSSVTLREGIRARLRQSSGVGVALQIRLPRWPGAMFAAAVPQATSAPASAGPGPSCGPRSGEDDEG
jgi:hypothetical protein